MYEQLIFHRWTIELSYTVDNDITKMIPVFCIVLITLHTVINYVSFVPLEFYKHEYNTW